MHHVLMPCGVQCVIAGVQISVHVILAEQGIHLFAGELLRMFVIFQAEHRKRHGFAHVSLLRYQGTECTLFLPPADTTHTAWVYCNAIPSFLRLPDSYTVARSKGWRWHPVHSSPVFLRNEVGKPCADMGHNGCKLMRMAMRGGHTILNYRLARSPIWPSHC